MIASRNAIQFDHVWKSFQKGESATALRDAIPNLVRTLLRQEKPQETSSTFNALEDVSFSVKKGETLGLIGPNGAGKTTILKLIAGILRPQSGTIEKEHPMGTLIELGAGFHPDLTGRENVYLYGSILGLSKKEVHGKFDDIARFAEIGEFMEMPLKRFSTGMGLRLGFSVIAHLDPKVLLVDEVLAVGDMYFQRKCLDRIRQYKEKGTSIILVSHDLWLIQSRCDRVLYLSGGKIAFDGKPTDVIERYSQDVKKQSLGKGGNDSQDTGERFGSYEAEITHVRILGEDSAEKEEFKLDEKMVVSLDYQTKKKIVDPCFGVSVFDVEGNYVYGAATRLDGISIDKIEGKGNVSFVVDHLPLYSGLYYLSTAIMDKDAIYYDMHRMKYAFRVKK